MRSKHLLSMIERRKKILNFLIKYLSPTNKIIVYLSQDLDKLIVEYQSIYLKTRRCKTNVRYTLAA